jgi:hypothetical protein
MAMTATTQRQHQQQRQKGAKFHVRSGRRDERRIRKGAGGGTRGGASHGGTCVVAALVVVELDVQLRKLGELDLERVAASVNVLHVEERLGGVGCPGKGDKCECECECECECGSKCRGRRVKANEGRSVNQARVL